MSSTIKLRISTPNGIFLEDEVDIVTLKTTEGYIGLQHNRLPFISSIEISPMYITKNNEKKVVAIGGGIVFVERTNIDIFTDDIEWKEDLNKSEIEKIIQNYKSMFESERLNNIEKHKIELSLKRAINKLSIIGE